MTVIPLQASPEEWLQRVFSFIPQPGGQETVSMGYSFFSNNASVIKPEEKKQDILDIAEIAVSEMNLDAESVAAILLKEFADQELISKESIEKEYGSVVLSLISDLQKFDRIDTSKYTTNTENFIRFLLTFSDDFRVVLIRFANHLFAIRNIERYDTATQEKLISESSFLYIPITHRIGLYRIKSEFEDRVFQYKNPETYFALWQKLQETQRERDIYSEAFISPIEKRLKENGFDCEIKSRVKSIPSIQRKIEIQKVEFEKIYDLFAIRIIANNIVEEEKADCWKIYSLVTDIYPPNPRRLRDWISFPKATGYESLHTTVIGPEGRWVEVQIRSRRMDEIAEKSVAAHWRYKSEGQAGGSAGFYTVLREMLENPAFLSSDTAVSREKKSLYSDEIFVFTPKGDLKKLRAGYTVLDFAYEIHSSLGSTCTGAIVNSVMVPLKHVLQNGDTVKIITSRTQKPSHNWLEFVKSPRVINRIRHALKMETYKDSEAGKEILKNKVVQMGYEFNDLMIRRLMEYFRCENHLELYQKFGEGKLDPMKVRKAISETKTEEPVSEEAGEDTFTGRISEVLTGKEDFIIIDKRLNSVHYQFAKCCNPVQGDKIFAFVSITQGIRIHKTNCSNAREMITRYPYRILEARWKEVGTEKTFTARLQISGKFSEGILEKVTQFLTYELKSEVRSSRLTRQQDGVFTCELGIMVRGKSHLDEVTNRLKKMKEVDYIKRVN